MCAERIHKGALVCRHCGANINRGPNGNDSSQTSRSRHGRRKAALALTLVLAAAALAAAATLGYLYQTERNTQDDRGRELQQAQTDLTDAQTTLRRVERELATAADENASLRRQLEAAAREYEVLSESLAEIAVERAARSYREGYKDALCCFDGGWNTGQWYLVKIDANDERPRLKWEITKRYDDLRDCQIMFLDDDDLYTRNDYGC